MTPQWCAEAGNACTLIAGHSGPHESAIEQAAARAGEPLTEGNEAQEIADQMSTYLHSPRGRIDTRLAQIEALVREVREILDEAVAAAAACEHVWHTWDGNGKTYQRCSRCGGEKPA